MMATIKVESNILINDASNPEDKANAKRLHSTSSHASSGVSSADNTSTRNGNPSDDSDNSRLGSIEKSEISRKSNDEITTESLPEGFAEDRFRVDRKRLEMLLSQSVKLDTNTNATSLTRAEAFFLEVMNSTNTQVSWPSRLKVGAKSKKDPHIKITGPVEQVKIAKDRIMQQLDSKSSRVTIKMDVSHTDHSHVIGKGGCNIKSVMKETECHIHFPDSNRNSNVNEKSNQVSIAGQASGVELARQRIRELLPITLFFDFPTKHIGNLDLNSPAIQNIVKTYNISIQIKSRKPYTTVLQIRGCVSNQIGLKDGVVCLMQILTGQLGQTIPVSCIIEIQNVQSFLNAKSVAKIKAIQSNTGITIDLPNNERKTQIMDSGSEKVVCMTGSCEGVLFARQEIISHLPLVLMFDLKEDVSASVAQQIGEKFECFVSIKSKSKQATKSCIIKSSEANVYNMFKARQALMKLSCNGLEDIPMPVNTASFLFNQKMQSVANYQAQMAQMNVQTAVKANTRQGQQNITPSFTPSWNKVSVQSTANTQKIFNKRPMQINTKSINKSSESASSGNPSTDSVNSSTTKSLDKCSGIIRQPNPPPTNGSHYTSRSRDETSEASSSGFLDRKTMKISSIQNRQGSLSSVDSCHTNTKKSHDDCISSGHDCQSSDLSDNESKDDKKVISESYYKPVSFRVTPSGFKAKANLKLQAGDASYYSTTSDNSDEQITSNKKPQAKKVPSDLATLFKCLNLEKYTEAFLEQEIDLQTFSTMSDNDLRELGVNTFGARRKMSMAIKELNGQRSNQISTASISLRMK